MSSNQVIARQSLIRAFLEKFPKDAAMVLDHFTSEKILEYLQMLSDEHARKVFSQLNPDVASEVIVRMDDQQFIQIFSMINTHLGARLLSRLPEKDVDVKLALLPKIPAREMKEFMTYPRDSAGYLMDTSVTTFHPENTIEQVLQRLRIIRNRNIPNIYIVNESGILLGKIPLQTVAISQPEEKLSKLLKMSEVVDGLASREEVLQILEREKVLQIPVIDVNRHLLGVIRNDELINATKQDITEDLQAMFGAGKEERALSKVSFAVRKRLPWLQVNLATAFLASFVVGLFEDTIAKITILAVFLPVVAGQSGNTGSQALAVTMRGLALKEIRMSQWFRVAKKEILVGLINGIAVAFTTAIIVYFWSASLGIAVVIAVSMILSMMIAGFSGAGIPMALKAVGQDPATSSSIILTTVTDICGFLSFLGLATALSSILGIV